MGFNEMRKYSANYSHSNHNFVIQNLIGERINDEYLSAFCILKNILQRGKPTLLSTYLQEELGQIHVDLGRLNDELKQIIDELPPSPPHLRAAKGCALCRRPLNGK